MPGSPGPVESMLNTYNSGKVLGLVAGAFAELSSAFHVVIDLIACQLADGHLQFFDIGHWTCKSIFLQQVRHPASRVGQTHARPLPGPHSAPQPRPTAAETIDEDDKETHTFYHHTHPLGYGR